MNFMKRILVVDNEIEFCEWLGATLIGAGFDAVTASNGRQAIAILQQETFDLVITDMLMPEMDGAELLRTLQRQWPHLKVIAMSGGGFISSSNYLKLAKAMGAHKILPKPFPGKTVINAVKTLLETKPGPAS